MNIPDCCVDCARPLPIDRPIFLAAGGYGARCERCDVLAAAGELEVVRLRELRQAEREKRKTP